MAGECSCLTSNKDKRHDENAMTALNGTPLCRVCAAQMNRVMSEIDEIANNGEL